MPATEHLLSPFNLDATSQFLVYAILALFGFVWWAYTNARKDFLASEKGTRAVLETLYAPAHGLLMSKHSGKLTSKQFEEKFCDLLVHHRSKANAQVYNLMDKWLNTQDGAEAIEDELLACLELLCTKHWVRLQHDGLSLEYPVKTILWTINTAFSVVFLVAALPAVLVAITWIAWGVNQLPGIWPLLVLAFGFVASVGLVTLVVWSKRRHHQRSLSKAAD